MSDNYQSSTTKCHQQPPPFMPEELIIQILLRLPVRPLLVFKCVCKLWKTLISDPKFVKRNLEILMVKPSITHQHIFSSRRFYGQRKIVSMSVKSLLENPSKPTILTTEFMENKFIILGSCNGLLCLFDMDQGYVQLWNPTIGFKSKKSPTLDSFGERTFVIYSGFGYDHINDKYKLFVVVEHDSGSHYSQRVTQIFTFGGTSWTTIENFLYATNLDGNFVSGTLNWIILKSGVSSNKRVILSFDLVKETYKEVLLPEQDGDEIHNARLGVWSDCICVCFESNKINCWDFWLMKTYGVVESWTRLMTIPREPFFLWNCGLSLTPSFVEPLFFFENSNVLLRTCNKLLLYNLDNGSFNYISDNDDILNHHYIYYESLVSPQF